MEGGFLWKSRPLLPLPSRQSLPRPDGCRVREPDRHGHTLNIHPDGRDDTATNDTDGFRRARLLGGGGAKRAVMEATGRMHRGIPAAFRARDPGGRRCRPGRDAFPGGALPADAGRHQDPGGRHGLQWRNAAGTGAATAAHGGFQGGAGRGDGTAAGVPRRCACPGPCRRSGALARDDRRPR